MFAIQHHIRGTSFLNTLEGTQEKRGDRFELRLIFEDSVSGVSWPYNPLLYIKQNRGREVHLAGYQPTELADSSFFSTADDVSVPGTAATYKDIDGMPFAMLLPSSWEWPIEFVDITNSFPYLRPWAESNGVNNTDWCDIKIPSLIWSVDDSVPQNDGFNNDSKAAFWTDVDHGNRTSLIEEIDQKLKITVAAADIWKSTNNYAARYTSLDGNFDVSVKVESQDNTHPWAKAGIIVKENMATAENNLCFIGVTPGNGFAFQYDWSGAGLINGHKGAYYQTQGVSNFVRLVREGNTIIGYHKSDNETSWTETSRKSFTDLPSTLQVGLFAVSHSYEYGTVVFDDFTLVQ
jgi:hypothetical protein